MTNKWKQDMTQQLSERNQGWWEIISTYADKGIISIDLLQRKCRWSRQECLAICKMFTEQKKLSPLAKGIYKIII